ncbi:MAG TPA: PQQ-binding-like beta-propeller repeat protein [Caulobacteraceae bacterium]|nr:PQQ-binding-like beta-propeller repeat protein [Caulobacteraceae bacterium]
MNRSLKVAAAVAALCVGLSACGTISRLNPFGKDDGPGATASKGERIPVLTFDQTVTPSEALAGTDFLLPDAQAVSAWPLPGGTAEQTMEHVEAAPAFEVAWRRGVGAGSGRKTQVTAPPVAIDGRVYTMDGEATVTASDAKSGSAAWRADLEPNEGKDREAFGGGLAVAEGKVFVTSGFRFAAALDAATGAVLWQTRVESPIHAAPTVSGGRVYAVDVDNQVIAFNAADGSIAWSHQAIVEPARILKASSPAVSGDAVITPFSSGELIALRAGNGSPLWSEVLSRTSRTSALSEIRDIAGRPAVYRGDVFAVSHSGVFAAVDLRTGRRRWDLPLSGVSSPWPAGDVVYVLSQQGELVAVNRDSGQAYWVRDLNEGRGRKKGGFAGFGGRSVEPVWTGPMLASGRLVLVNDQGEAVALDPKTGAVQKTVRLGGAAYIAPIAYDGMIYVVTDKGDLVALR